jgi:citrate synthase
MPETLTITDNRTGRTYEVPIEQGAIRATALRQIKLDDDDFGILSYDPAFLNTASTRSAITFLDGDRGILRYGGYPIEQLADRGTYLETAYLLLHGELPTPGELDEWTDAITHHTFVHENVKQLMEGFRYDAHPMGMFVSAVAALSTFYPEASRVEDPAVRLTQIQRLIAKVPTIAAFSYRHSRGLPYVYPENDRSFVSNFLSMMFRMAEPRYEAQPALERALEVLFILHADHEQNCSTNAIRSIGSSLVDPYSALAGAAAALYGPLHGGANEAVLRMLAEIGDVQRVAEFIERVKAGEGRLMGFGHRVYKNYDPRAKIMRETCHEVLEELGLHNDRIFKLAMALEKIALEDDYFVSRKLYPNVDFYSGIVQRALGIPVAMFTCIFSLARTVGWIAQWQEMISDPEYKIGRPRQLYSGSPRRDFVPMAKRKG